MDNFCVIALLKGGSLAVSFSESKHQIQLSVTGPFLEAGNKKLF
jgi:hypothetical protein